LRERCQLVDEVLCDLWQALALPVSLALVAVGGYGRGELYPASDVDILLLLPQTPDEALTARLERAVALFYDIGLDIAPSVRTVEECTHTAAADLTIQTALLEARLLAGNSELFQEACIELKGNLDPQPSSKPSGWNRKSVTAAIQDSPYSLEPNCKEAPGGLRDLQTILWIARAAGYGDSWEDLAQHGFITPEEQLNCSAVLLFCSACERACTCMSAGAKIACCSTTRRRSPNSWVSRPPHPPGQRTADAGYYRTAKEVTQINTILLLNIGAAISPPPSSCRCRSMNASRTRTICWMWSTKKSSTQQPGAISKPFLLMQKHPELQGMTARTLRALWHARTLIDDDFRRDPGQSSPFPRNPQTAARRAARASPDEPVRTSRAAICPTFGKIVGQMQHDLFHVYTVDQHTLQVLRNLRRFLADEFAHEYPLCSELISDFPRCWVLYVAALFHDIGKGRGGDHSELGAVDAAEFCRRARHRRRGQRPDRLAGPPASADVDRRAESRTSPTRRPRRLCHDGARTSVT
jgi:[protein-PII] uridylyltransferase